MINDLGDGIKSRVRLFADTILYSVIRTPTDSIQLQDDLRITGVLGKEVANVL